MPDTQQNTEFSVKADPITVSVAERCEEGKRLRKEWLDLYNTEVKKPGDGWQQVLMKGFEPYLRHFAKCAQCMDYEYLLRGKMLTITEEEKK